MSICSFSLVGKKYSLVMSLSSLLILSLCAVFPVSGSVDAQSERDIRPTITVVPSSEPRFFECGVTTGNGTASADENAQSVLTDGNLDTIMMGKSIFDISNVNSSIVNIPGPDLVVTEMLTPELINASIPSFDTGEIESLVLVPVPSNDTTTNSCQYTMNHAFVDLNSFGIEEGSAVPSIRIDNLGVADTLNGSDIAEILILKPGTVSPRSNTAPIPFFTFN